MSITDQQGSPLIKAIRNKIREKKNPVRKIRGNSNVASQDSFASNTNFIAIWLCHQNQNDWGYWDIAYSDKSSDEQRPWCSVLLSADRLGRTCVVPAKHLFTGLHHPPSCIQGISGQIWEIFRIQLVNIGQPFRTPMSKHNLDSIGVIILLAGNREKLGNSIGEWERSGNRASGCKERLGRHSCCQVVVMLQCGSYSA